MTATITTLHPRGGHVTRLNGDHDRAALHHVLAGGQLVRLSFGLDEGFQADMRVAREHGKETRPVLILHGDARGDDAAAPSLNLFSVLEANQMVDMLLELLPPDADGEPGLMEAAQRVLRHAASELRRPTTLLALSEDLFAENARPKTVKARVSVSLAARAHVFAHGRAGRMVASATPTHDLTSVISHGESLVVSIPRMGASRDALTMARLLLRALHNVLSGPQAPRGTNLLVMLEEPEGAGTTLLQELVVTVKKLGGRLVA